MNEIRQYIEKLGRAGAHAAFPTEFEYYAITLELTSGGDKTEEFLTFPVSPDNILYDDQTLTNIKKTFGGVSVTDSGTNRPRRISLSGSFGRKFRLLTSLNNHVGGSASGGLSPQLGTGLEIKSNILSIHLKTGYGATRILKSIIEKSVVVDSQKRPKNLYLYFPVLGENYLVKINSFRLTQDVQSSNMLWQYSIELTVVANLAEIKSKVSPGRALANDLIQKGVGGVLNKITNIL